MAGRSCIPTSPLIDISLLVEDGLVQFLDVADKPLSRPAKRYRPRKTFQAEGCGSLTTFFAACLQHSRGTDAAGEVLTARPLPKGTGKPNLPPQPIDPGYGGKNSSWGQQHNVPSPFAAILKTTGAEDIRFDILAGQGGMQDNQPPPCPRQEPLNPEHGGKRPSLNRLLGDTDTGLIIGPRAGESQEHEYTTEEQGLQMLSPSRLLQELLLPGMRTGLVLPAVSRSQTWCKSERTTVWSVPTFVGKLPSITTFS